MMDASTLRFLESMHAVAGSNACTGAERIVAALLAARTEELCAVPVSLAASLLARLPDGTGGDGAGAADRGRAMPQSDSDNGLAGTVTDG